MTNTPWIVEWVAGNGITLSTGGMSGGIGGGFGPPLESNPIPDAPSGEPQNRGWFNTFNELNRTIPISDRNPLDTWTLGDGSRVAQWTGDRWITGSNPGWPDNPAFPLPDYADWDAPSPIPETLTDRDTSLAASDVSTNGPLQIDQGSTIIAGGITTGFAPGLYLDFTRWLFKMAGRPFPTSLSGANLTPGRGLAMRFWLDNNILPPTVIFNLHFPNGVLNTNNTTGLIGMVFAQNATTPTSLVGLGPSSASQTTSGPTVTRMPFGPDNNVAISANSNGWGGVIANNAGTPVEFVAGINNFLIPPGTELILEIDLNNMVMNSGPWSGQPPIIMPTFAGTRFQGS